MARTISEIKKSMTDRFMSDSVIRGKYGLSEGDTFESKFSKVSVENILFFIVAASIYALESIFDQFRDDVDAKIAGAVIASVPWYHKICLEYQHGDSLVFDDRTQEFRYSQEDDSKKVIRYASVRENAAGVNILVSGEKNGAPEQLSTDVLTAFKSYLNKRKPAGVLMDVRSYPPDYVQVNLRVQYNPIVMSPDGSLIANPDIFPVRDAVKKYFAGIVYGGVLNKTRLTDAVQSAEGVEDVKLGSVHVKTSVMEAPEVVTNNNFPAFGGSFTVDNIENSIIYVQEL